MRGDSRRPVPDEPTLPGEHLVDTLRELGISQSALARKMGRPQQVVNEICRGVKAITAETALQLEAALGISAETWMALETNYRLAKARLALPRRSIKLPATVRVTRLKA
jgi:HTH-type transcriptional regulator/antitoxin HigA